MGTSSICLDGLPSVADGLLFEDFCADVPLEAADFSAEPSCVSVSPDAAELLVKFDWEVPHPDNENANTRTMITAPTHVSFNRAMIAPIGFNPFGHYRSVPALEIVACPFR